MSKDPAINKESDRPEAYPQPSKSDKQFNNQPEFEDQQPNDFNDKSISDVPVNAPRQNNDPNKDLKNTKK